jgi:ADP-ribose pyrophosphatase YjhB (NUDIX family)
MGVFDLSKYHLVMPVVTMLFIRNGKVLILERGNPDGLYYGWFELPGGKVKEYELNPMEAALREETLLRISEAVYLETRGFLPDPKNNKPITTWAHIYIE